MKENSIKEDIERLELCSTNKCNICGRYEKEECMLERNRCEQHILLDYKRVLKENEEIKENCKKCIIRDELDEYVNNSIPIQKIKDKIKELKKKVEELTDEKGYWGGSDLLEQIKVLEEMLEKEK